MKRNDFKKAKTDYVFMIVLIILLIGILLCSLLFKVKQDNISIEDLPDNFTFSTNKLIISEVVSSNKGIYSNENNQVVDYIELYNGTDKTIDLTGYGLSDRDDRVKWLFPDCQIEPQQYLVVALTGIEESGLNANFKLSSSGGEKLILVNSSYKVIDAVETIALGKNQSMNRKDDGSFFISDYGTPGFENSKQGLQQYLSSIEDETDNALVINEVLVKNEGNFLNEDNLLSGYIEIKNVSDHSVNLSEYSLSGDIYLPFRYQFGDYVLESNEVYLVYTLDNDSKEFLMNKISNTERLAGIIIKILKVIGFVFIGYIIFMIIAVIGLGTYTVVKKDNANVESSATTICSIDNKKYQIEFGTNNYFKCNNCSKKMSDEINEIVDFNNIDNSMINIENYFKNNNGTCE